MVPAAVLMVPTLVENKATLEVLVLCEAAPAHISLLVTMLVTVVAMGVLQLPVALVVVQVAMLAMVVIPLPTPMVPAAVEAPLALVVDIVLHTAIPVAAELVLLVKVLLAQVLAIWVATAAVAAKTANQAKIPTTAMANQTGLGVFTVVVVVAQVTMSHSVTA